MDESKNLLFLVAFLLTISCPCKASIPSAIAKFECSRKSADHGRLRVLLRGGQSSPLEDDKENVKESAEFQVLNAHAVPSDF